MQHLKATTFGGGHLLTRWANRCLCLGFAPAWVNVERYNELMLRAVAAVLQPWGIKREWLDEWVLQDWYQTYFYLPQGKATAVTNKVT